MHVNHPYALDLGIELGKEDHPDWHAQLQALDALAEFELRSLSLVECWNAKVEELRVRL